MFRTTRSHTRTDKAKRPLGFESLGQRIMFHADLGFGAADEAIQGEFAPADIDQVRLTPAAIAWVPGTVFNPDGTRGD